MANTRSSTRKFRVSDSLPPTWPPQPPTFTSRNITFAEDSGPVASTSGQQEVEVMELPTTNSPTGNSPANKNPPQADPQQQEASAPAPDIELWDFSNITVNDDYAFPAIISPFKSKPCKSNIEPVKTYRVRIAHQLENECTTMYHYHNGKVPPFLYQNLAEKVTAKIRESAQEYMKTLRREIPLNLQFSVFDDNAVPLLHLHTNNNPYESIVYYMMDGGKLTSGDQDILEYPQQAQQFQQTIIHNTTNEYGSLD